MTKKTFVIDGDLIDLEPKLQEIAIKKPKKTADGAVEKAFDKFLSLIERLLK
jgi:hypothetical protein